MRPLARTGSPGPLRQQVWWQLATGSSVGNKLGRGLGRANPLAGGLARVREWASSVAGRTPQYETSQSQLPRVLREGLSLSEARGAREARGCAHPDCDHDDHPHHEAHDHGELFDTWSCRPERVFDPDALRAWLRDTPPGLLRLKGVLRTGDAAWSEIQFAGRHGALRKAGAPSDGSAVVAIALRGRLPVAALEAVFAASA
ncbi:GTP-binding protein [Variovorax paradoxus]|nr:GTP-binding protein [Variovorax paradoxus]